MLGVKNFPVLVGGGTDGAAVNVAGTGGLKGQLTQALPWIYWSWCYAHRLELACRDAFISPLFSAIENLLLRLYYLYEKSPKKSRDLAAIIEDLKEFFSFPNGGNLPVRCQGTRWVSHKRKALQRVLDRYGAYIAHLIALTEDRSIKAEDRERCRGYLHKWKQPKTLIGCAMYIEALKPLSLLSLSLQGEGADIVLSMVNTMKSVKSLKKLTQQEVSEWPMVKLVKKRLKDADGNQEYQGVAISDFDATLETCSRDVMADLRRLDGKIKARLEWSDTDLLRAVVAFLSTHNWLMREDTQDSDEEGIVDPDEVSSDMREAVEYIITAFRAPLEARGFSAEAILAELEEAISYARKYLPIATETYKKIWYTLHTCPDASKWPNVLMLCQLIFSLPFSTSGVEQVFSQLKVIKTNRRTNLQNDTLHALLEICVEGPPLSTFSADPAVDLWWRSSSTTRRVNQNPRKEYRQREKSHIAVGSSENFSCSSTCSFIRHNLLLATADFKCG